MLVRYRPDARSRLCSGITLAVSILAAVLTTVVFLIDVIFVAVLRHELKDGTNNQVKATWGVGVSLDHVRMNEEALLTFRFLDMVGACGSHSALDVLCGCLLRYLRLGRKAQVSHLWQLHPSFESKLRPFRRVNDARY